MHPLRLARALAVFILLPSFIALLTGCSQASASGQASLKMAPMANMPDEVKSAATVVQQAYQFAAANPDVLQHIPCYCGCDAIGHTSNYACYVDGVDQNGTTTFDAHAQSCSICVDITQDVMHSLKEGKSLADIKSYIDQTYSQYGPSNMP